MNTNTALEVDNESLASRAEDALQQLLYSAHAFAAVVAPVSISMILASMAVVYVNDGLNGRTTGGQGIPVVVQERESDDSEARFTAALANALTYVSVIIGATFFMVFLYYFRFMKLLIGWLVTSTALLFAFSTGLLVQTGMTLVQVPFDAISYSFLFFNFAVVGVTAVFYQKGVPQILTGGYLIVVSVTMAWILIRFLPEWTSWVFLAVLAFYDLCAVLTPCGPLKWLVGIMQERDEPLPGLLYEARVRQGVNNPPPNDSGSSSAAASNGNPVYQVESTSRHASRADVEAQEQQHPPLPTPPPPGKPPKPSRETAASLSNALRAAALTSEDELSSSRPASLPNPPRSTTTNASLPVTASQQTTSQQAQITQPPLPSFVSVRPVPGTTAMREDEVLESRLMENDGDYDDDRSIKLGLGDFVFYSILCAKAALVSFTTFIAVFIVVLFGLAMTLVLLAVYRTALPALPISILLGLIFFFAVDTVVVPFVESFAFQIAFS